MMLSKTIPIIFRRENLMNKYTETNTNPYSKYNKSQDNQG